jgi:hypothetical protein
MYRVVVTEKAEADVESVLKWFHEQMATEAGGKWLAGLTAKLDTLEAHPERCSLADEAEEVVRRSTSCCLDASVTSIGCCFVSWVKQSKSCGSGMDPGMPSPATISGCETNAEPR